MIEAHKAGRCSAWAGSSRRRARIFKDTGKLDAPSVVARVRDFLGGQPPQDDMCLLSLQFGGQENGAR